MHSIAKKNYFKTWAITLKTAKLDDGDGPLAPELMAELASKFQLSAFIETGTYLGNTTAAAVPFFKELHTIELSPDLAHKAAQRFASLGKVCVYQGDSADRLEEILNQLSGPPLIWLDGHYSEGITARGRENTPIIDELKSIDRSGISNALILIDDLRMFDTRETKAGDPPSLAGYPSIQELYRLVASMQQKYEMYVYGDIALILPAGAAAKVSPLVQALTISRLYDGSNLTLEEVIAAEEIIVNSCGTERDALRKLAGSRAVRFNEIYTQGLHYRYWEGLSALGEDVAAAEQLFVKAGQLGFTHPGLKWFLAHSYGMLEKPAEMKRILTELLDSNPGFIPALTLLAQTGGSGNIPLADTSIATVSPPGSSSVLSDLEARKLWSRDKPLRLHLGCGEQIFPGYVNIDYPTDEHNVMQVKADYTANITQLDFPPQSVDEIRLHHVFEHFNRVTALAMLIKWQQWLKIGGKLHIETPDLMGSAEILTSDLPWQVKMGTVRHLAGDQAAAWAYHVDHWFPERYQHTLKRFGFSDVNTQTNRWPHSPYLCNVQALGTKTQNLNPDQLLAVADELLWESTVAPAEKPTHTVWTQQLRSVLNNVHCGLKNIHIAESASVPTVPSTNPAPVGSPAHPHHTAPPILKSGVLPLDEIHNFNQRCRDRWVQAKALSVPAASRVLDMGAGTCLYRPLFSHCDYKTHDFKKYEGAEKHGGTSAYGHIDYVSEILAIPAPDHSFDVILCTEVLEHVPEPIQVLKEISRLLRPGGRAFITAPLGSGLHQLPFHFYGGYTPEWYKRFSKEAGMEAIEITPNGGFFKHLAQECSRAASIYGQNPQLHGPEAPDIYKLLTKILPQLFFSLDDKCFDERFTVGYFVESVKLDNSI